MRDSLLSARPAAALATHRLWLWLFVTILALLIVSILVEALTENEKFIPSILALGAFAVPVAFIGFIGSRVPAADVTLAPVAVCFFAGGIIGTAVASILEWDTLRDIGAVPVILVGSIEEPAKLVVPVAFFFAARYVLTTDGLILGVAAGIGFAAFETMGYALVALLHAGWDRFIEEPVPQTIVGVVSAGLLVLCVVVARRELATLRPETEVAAGARSSRTAGGGMPDVGGVT